MKFKQFSKVKLITDKYKEDGAIAGMVGVVLDIYETGDYEIQFFNNQNELTDIFFPVNENDIIEYIG